MKICLVRLSALGDVLMIVPLIRTLQKTYPKAQITWIISPLAYELVSNIKDIDFIILPKPKNILDLYKFYKLMKNKKFDVLLGAQASLRANILFPFIKAKRKIGYDKFRAKDCHRLFIKESIDPGNEHTLDGFLKFAKALNIENYDLRWDIPINEKDKLWAKKIISENKLVVIVNPASSKPERSWLKERYVEVIKAIKEKYTKAIVILTGGPSLHDLELGTYIESKIEVINLIAKTKPKQLLALIAKADLVLCPDTGPSHMAAAMNTPVIALHAVTSPEVSGPYIFRPLAIDYYDKAAEKFLGKNAKDIAWGTQIHGTKTMSIIPTKIVIEKVMDFLKKIEN